MTSVANDVSLGRQALRRSVNERIRSTIVGSEPGTIDVFCECGRVRCSDRLQIAIGDYDGVLGTSGRYVVREGHEDGSELTVGRQDGVLVVDRSGG